MPAHLKELFTYRLNVLAHLASRLAAERNARESGLSMREWRILGLLGAFAPLSLNELAREANLDKSQASRTVSEMTARGLIKRAADETDGRGVRLGLTATGKACYRRVFPQAVSRNEALLAVLTPAEREVLDVAFTKLSQCALAMLAEEKLRVNGTRRRTPNGDHHVRST